MSDAKTLSDWLDPLDEQTRANYRRSVELLGQQVGGVAAAVELLTRGDEAAARSAVRAVASQIAAAGHAPGTVRQRVTALCSLARHAGRDLGLRQARGGWRPRRRAPAAPDEARERRARELPPAADVATALALWAPSLRRLADVKGLTVPGALAWALSVASAETSGSGHRLAGRAASELSVLSDDVAHGIRERRRAHRPAKERPPAVVVKPLTLTELEALHDAEIDELERAAKAREVADPC